MASESTATLEPVIGIDLGTTNSCVALWNKDSQDVEILFADDGNNIFPSWVSYGDDGTEITVGRAAKDKSNFFYDTKRIIGKQFAEVKKDKELQRSLPFTLVPGENSRAVIKPFKDVNRNIDPEEVASKILKEAKSIASRRCGKEVKKAVVTVPAYFNNSQKEATKQAAEIAGLEILRLIPEPTSAAIACGFHVVDDDKNIAVIDFGGGTFDTTVFTSGDGILDVQATKGNMRLGGRDLDEVIFKMCKEQLEGVNEQEGLMQIKQAKKNLEITKEPLKDQNVRNRLL